MCIRQLYEELKFFSVVIHLESFGAQGGQLFGLEEGISSPHKNGC